jgi:DNA-binding LacI/PurR family transcriptional regulator
MVGRVKVDLETVSRIMTGRISASQKIASQLRAKIEQQEYETGEWLPTERELAETFQVDRSTIRAALSHLADHNVIIRQPGRRPWVNSLTDGNLQTAGRAMPRAMVQMIAAVIPQPHNYPAFPAIQRGILRVLRRTKSPFRFLVFDNQGEDESQCVSLELHALDAIENEGIAGAILWQMGGSDTLRQILRLQERGIPIILLDRCPPDFPGDFIGVDNHAAAMDAVRYLLDLGHKRIAHLTTCEDVLTVHQREEGYREALTSAGLRPDSNLIVRLEDFAALRPDTSYAAEHFLSLANPPTAVFTMKDSLAHLLIPQLRIRGCRVPEDISIIGFDDQDHYSLSPPWLSTVHQPFEKMGQSAAELLVRRLTLSSAAKSPYKHLLLPTPLVIRSTCAAISEARAGANLDTGLTG